MRYQVTTPLTPREALEQALADFGPGGLGLQLTSQTNLSVVLQGGGGHIAVTGSWGATEQETGVSQRSPSQNSYFLRKKAAYGGMGICLFAKVSCKSQNLCSNFCKSMAATY
jgi:hypothetical protein